MVQHAPVTKKHLSLPHRSKWTDAELTFKKNTKNGLKWTKSHHKQQKSGQKWVKTHLCKNSQKRPKLVENGLKLAEICQPKVAQIAKCRSNGRRWPKKSGLKLKMDTWPICQKLKKIQTATGSHRRHLWNLVKNTHGENDSSHAACRLVGTVTHVARDEGASPVH